MTQEQIAAFYIFSLVAAITPGPSNVIIAATGSSVGMWRGLPCAIGCVCGMATLMFSAALGLGQLIAVYGGIVTMMNWGGAAFLLWLAWKIASADPDASGQAAKPVGFITGALFQWVNPKGWLVAVGAVSTFLQAGAPNQTLQAVQFGGLFFCAALPASLVWLGMGSMMQRLLKDRRAARIFNLAMGAALAGSVAMFLL
ncbi:MAG: hypothetical protein VR78_05725 [Hoeflea sp. BRH_c9]|nr:MAG: hypothetical protein VR78_05725 [Hoeflea sp. BRH_c9]